MVKVGDNVRVLHNGWCNEDKRNPVYKNVYNVFDVGQIVEVVGVEAKTENLISITVVGRWRGHGTYLRQSLTNDTNMKVFEVV